MLPDLPHCQNSVVDIILKFDPRWHKQSKVSKFYSIETHIFTLCTVGKQITRGCKAIRNVQTSSVMVTGCYGGRIEKKAAVGRNKLLVRSSAQVLGPAETDYNMLPMCGGATSPSGPQEVSWYISTKLGCQQESAFPGCSNTTWVSHNAPGHVESAAIL